MKKVQLIVGIVLVIGIAAAAAALTVNKNDGKTNSNVNEQNASSSEPNMSQMSSSSENSANTQQTVPASEVAIKDFAFSPAKITVKKGTKVTWTNQDSVKHTITPDQENDNFKGSQLIGNGETYSFVFETAGTYTYHCTPHPYMKGTVEVTE